MGTFYGFTTKKQIVEELKRDRKIVKGKYVGNKYWFVAETTDPETEKPMRYIGLLLFSRSEKEWGYKPMEEMMGPYHYDCPVKFLEIAGEECPSKYVWSRKWRDELVAHQERAKRVLHVGDVIKVYDKEAVVISTPEGRDGYIIESRKTGKWYGLRKNQVADCEIVSRSVNNN